MEMREIPPDLIDRNPDQPRKHFDPEELEDLAVTFTQVGVAQPVVVKRIGERYQLIAGERRWRAAALAMLDTVPAIIRNDLTGSKQALLMLIENVQRSDLSTMEMARYICYLKDEEELTQEEITIALGNKTNRSAVAHYLRLLKLPLSVQKAIDDGELGFGHGKVLCGVDPDRQAEIATLAVKGSWTVRQLENYVKRSSSGKKASTVNKEVADALNKLETGASEVIGYPVQIQHSSKRNSGKVTIQYGSLDELDGIMAKMGYKPDFDD